MVGRFANKAKTSIAAPLASMAFTGAADFFPTFPNHPGSSSFWDIVNASLERPSTDANTTVPVAMSAPTAIIIAPNPSPTEPSASLSGDPDLESAAYPASPMAAMATAAYNKVDIRMEIIVAFGTFFSGSLTSSATTATLANPE